MVKRAAEELRVHEASGHFRCTAIRIHGKEETEAVEFWIGVFTLLPGGGAEYAYKDNPLEKVYYVLEGEMTVRDNGRSAYVIHRDESILSKSFESRYLKNKSSLPARILVIISYSEVR